MDENNIIKKKKNNRYYRHNNQNRYYYRNKSKKKKNLILENNDNEEINNILLFNETTYVPQPEVIDFEIKKEEYPKIEIPVIKAYELLKEKELKEDIVVPKQKKRNKINLNINKNILKYGTSFAILLLVIFGTSYSYFNYTKVDSRQADIASGEVYVRLVESPQTITLNKMYPMDDNEARERNDNYFDFTIKGKNTSSTKPVLYSININNGNDVTGKTRIDPQYIKVDLQEKINNNYEYILEGIALSDYAFMEAIPVNTTSEVTKEYRLRIWVGDNIIISDTETGASYTQAQFNNLFATYNISIDSRDAKLGIDMVRDAISAKVNAETNSCNPIWVDNMGTENDTSDDVTYFSGTNDCVDMNYVWYSGKLWRIVAIYPDGSMKLITQDNMISLNWGSTNQFNGSWVYQWLNEDFYDTLYNKESIVKQSVWNYSVDTSSTPSRPETLGTQQTISTNVGLINKYEYYNGYRNAEWTSHFLINKLVYFLLTPTSSSQIYYADSGGAIYTSSTTSNGSGVRPSIVIKSNLEFTGDGSITSPFKITGDREDAINNTTLLNSRSVGEYVKFDNKLYRIVDINNGITKIIMDDYISENDAMLTKSFASSTVFGKSSNTQSDDYWDYYLNNTWYNNITSIYRNMLVNGTYYLGSYPNSTNYKSTICKDANLDSVTTKNCTKYTNSDTDKMFVGKVGLSRVGEMFAGVVKYSALSNTSWQITPTPDKVRYTSTGFLYAGLVSGRTAVHPTLTLKSTIKITGGTGYVGGDTNSPFEISE